MEKILNVLVITIIAFKRAFFPVYLASSLLRNLLDISFPSFGSSRGEEKSCANLVRRTLSRFSGRRQSEVWSGYVSGCVE